MKYSLFSQNTDQNIAWFDKFDKEQIKQAIIGHLEQNKDDVLEYCKEFPKNDTRKYYGNEILAFYGNNKNGVPSKIITRGNNEYFKSLN